MATNFDFTDKTQQSITDAIQLANDYANAQGPFFLSLLLTSLKLPLLISTPCPSCFRPYQSALTFTFHSIWNSFVRLCHTESRWRFRKFPSRSPYIDLVRITLDCSETRHSETHRPTSDTKPPTR